MSYGNGIRPIVRYGSALILKGNFQTQNTITGAARRPKTACKARQQGSFATGEAKESRRH
jgi:hypothetical protein